MAETAMKVLTITLMIAIPLGITALNAWINITIKFAPDAAHATREAKAIFLKLAGWTAHIVVVGFLVVAIIWPNPNPRLDVLTLVANSISAFGLYVIWMFRMILETIKKQGELVLGLSELVSNLAKNVHDHSEALKLLTDSN